MIVRLYRPGDNSDLARLFTETVRAISAGDYSSEQLKVWAEYPPNVGRWLGQLDGRLAFVANQDVETAGFITFEPDGHLDHLYVHPGFQRRGVASALLCQIEAESVSHGIGRIFTESSISARPFFEHAGFRVISQQSIELKGISFLNYRMEMFLTQRPI
jgi:putative acetyltransferase